MRPFRILGIAGSLRKRSFNLSLLEAAQEIAPDGVDIEIARLTHVPLYDADLEERGLPAPVADLHRKITEADALLLATPEYNHSMSGVMKNAIDWASRPPNPLKKKAVGLMGASPGMTGTARGQAAMRSALAWPGAFVLPTPETLVGRARERFDDQGRLVDSSVKKVIHSQIEALIDFAEHVDDRVKSKVLP